MFDASSGSSRSEQTSTKGGAGLRSPAYALFETLDAEAAAIEATGRAAGATLAPGYEATIQTFEEGQIVRGTVTGIRENEVIVDVGFKSEGTIPLQEFRSVDNLAVGDQFDVYLEKLENQEGLVVLSKEKADFFKVWGQIKDAHDNNQIVQGRVKRRIKGGLVVDLLGVDAFLPGSQIALRQVPNLDDLINQTLDFKIIKINKRRRNIVVSRRVVLEEKREELKKGLMGELEPGQIREGIVKNITDFGAFVDLGGVDGLLHLTDMTWGRVGHPSDVVQIGQKVNVKVLDFDREKEKISLGLKQLTPHPWEGVNDRYPVGARIKGRVVSITDYGAFIELEKGVEGLIHISEMSWTKHVKHPSKILSVGQDVEAVVLKVDKESQKISLGLKQTEPDPWTTIERRYPPGTRLKGIVRNLTNFGAFVEIEEGIDGLLHISDMSWAKRVRHPSEVVKKGDLVDVVVLEISQDKKRISLGMKQLTENPWERLAVEFAPDTDVTGKITRILDRGAVVEIRHDVEGFVPVGQMGMEDIQHPEQYFVIGEEIPLRVIKVDPKNKRIVLSVTAYLKTRDEAEVGAFMEKHPKKDIVIPVSSGDAIDDVDADLIAGAEEALES
ncbi:MAG TPA: 30S ribosomal protein S1 [Candidatus Krumholzibacteria bacterium]|jgi:small subunit ribosomal protein S1|nr:30S ribosomal protein S1 [Candidatus Krumholzibacteria bacterium]